MCPKLPRDQIEQAFYNTKWSNGSRQWLSVAADIRKSKTTGYIVPLKGNTYRNSWNIFDKSNLSLVKNNKFNYQFIRNNGKRENNEGNDTMGMQYRFWESL